MKEKKKTNVDKEENKCWQEEENSDGGDDGDGDEDNEEEEEEIELEKKNPRRQFMMLLMGTCSNDTKWTK